MSTAAIYRFNDIIIFYKNVNLTFVHDNYTLNRQCNCLVCYWNEPGL